MGVDGRAHGLGSVIIFTRTSRLGISICWTVGFSFHIIQYPYGVARTKAGDLKWEENIVAAIMQPSYIDELDD